MNTDFAYALGRKFRTSFRPVAKRYFTTLSQANLRVMLRRQEEERDRAQWHVDLIREVLDGKP